MKKQIEEVFTATATGATVAAAISLYIAQASVGRKLIKDEVRRRRFYIENISRYAKIALEAMRFEIETVGVEDKFKNKNYLIVSNHMSYTDIMCFSAAHSAMFVSSVDMGQTPFLGMMAELGGSLFVERRHRGQIDRDLSSIANALKQGFDVVLYPEGTSTNGQTVLPFKKSLLMAAVEAGVDILPMTIKYTEINGQAFSHENADKVCWYGDMSFAPHLLGLFQLDSVKVQLEFLEPIKVTSDSTRQELAEKAYRSVYKNYLGVEPSPESMAPRSSAVGSGCA